MAEFDPRLIRKNRKLFLNYSRLRAQYAYSLNHEKASVAFEIIPVLLTINEVDLPGYVPKAELACGVYGVGSSYKLREVIRDFFPEVRKRNIPFQHYLIRRPIVESLFVLGSIGTVAQTEDSDFDFWVCVDEAKWPRKTLTQLREKTANISYWCRSTFDMDVHFFILDLKQIQKNDFGRVDEESSGSSQKAFLKEECYRTMLFISGKIPYWWVLPPDINEAAYYRWIQDFKRNSPLDSVDFVDLGYMGEISKAEFLGNALWQLSKGIKDPFKSLLKMAMMEMYLSDRYQGPLLCDVLKRRVLDGRRFLRELDPYLLMVESVLNFYQERGRFGPMELLRKAFYLKAEPGLRRTRMRARESDYKIEVFRGLMDSWKWPLELVEDLNQIENWSYSRLLQFAKEINRFFSSTYRRLSEGLISKEKQAIDDYDLTVLGRKLLALFDRKRNKLQLTPFLTSKRLVLDRCVFRYERRGKGKFRWVLYDASWYPTESKRKKQRIFSSERVVRCAAWLVNNGLYDFHRTAVEMVPNPSGVILNDLIGLLKHFQSFFGPIHYLGADGAGFHMAPIIEKIMLIIDMEEMEKLKAPQTIDLVYRNTWGEMFTEAHGYEGGLKILSRYAREMNVKSLKDLNERFVIHLPNSGKEQGLTQRIIQDISKNIGMEQGEGAEFFGHQVRGYGG